MFPIVYSMRARIAAVLLLTATLCGCGTAHRETPSPSSRKGPAGPIAFLITVDSLDARGAVGPETVDFEPHAHAIVALAKIGNLTAPKQSITFTWFRDTPHHQRRQLFQHTVSVSTGDRAYSEGNSPGFLAQGSYSIVASLQGASVTTKFLVVPDPPNPDSAQASTATPAPPAPPPDLGGEPASGDSGVLNFNGPNAPPAATSKPGPGGCRLALSGDAAVTFTAESCASDTWNITANGGGGASQIDSGSGDAERVEGADPCQIGGSDLPGSKIIYTADVVVGPDLNTASTATTTLGPDKSAPAILSDSDPPVGGLVLAGEKIAVNLTVADNLGIGNSGVQSLRVTAGDTVLEQQSFGTAPVACDPARLERSVYVSYQVPDPAPEIVQLRVTAKDFAGNEATIDLQWFSNGHWAGNMNLDGVLVGQGQDCHDRWVLWIELYTSSIGPVRGIAQASRGHAFCTLRPESTDEGPAQGALDVIGNFDGKSFQLKFVPQSIPNGYYEGTFDYFPALNLLFYPSVRTISLPLKNRATTKVIDLKFSEPVSGATLTLDGTLGLVVVGSGG